MTSTRSLIDVGIVAFDTRSRSERVPRFIGRILPVAGHVVGRLACITVGCCKRLFVRPIGFDRNDGDRDVL